MPSEIVILKDAVTSLFDERTPLLKLNDLLRSINASGVVLNFADGTSLRIDAKKPAEGFGKSVPTEVADFLSELESLSKAGNQSHVVNVLAACPELLSLIKVPRSHLMDIVSKNPHAIMHIPNPEFLYPLNNVREAIQIRIISEYPDLLELIEKPSENLQIIAVSTYPYNIMRIKNPCERAMEIAANALGKEVFLRLASKNGVIIPPSLMESLSTEFKSPPAQLVNGLKGAQRGNLPVSKTNERLAFSR